MGIQYSESVEFTCDPFKEYQFCTWCLFINSSDYFVKTNLFEYMTN